MNIHITVQLCLLIVALNCHQVNYFTLCKHAHKGRDSLDQKCSKIDIHKFIAVRSTYQTNFIVHSLTRPSGMPGSARAAKAWFIRNKTDNRIITVWVELAYRPQSAMPTVMKHR
jgi:hypothetical protein